jgi:hypothetical protein
VSALVVLAAGRARRYGGVKPLAPIGPDGEAVIDLLAGDALRAGFTRLVLVVNGDTGPLIEAHVSSSWPAHVDVAFALQPRPLGTVDAVLAARGSLDTAVPFGIANADDLYGTDALEVLGHHLATAGTNCLVGFRLDRALVGDLPVTRGVCSVHDGVLVAIAERRNVTQRDGTFRADDGLEPVDLDPASLVSMNLWGLAPPMWGALGDAMSSAKDASEDDEVLLPELVGRLVASSGELSRFEVLSTTSRCIGVTHPDDLELVRAAIAAEVARGDRPAGAFDPV